MKINCSCGQNYAFEVEPIAGRMPGPVKCPACGADGTEAANAVIAQTLALRLQTLAEAQSHSGGRRRILHPALLITVLALLLLLVVVLVSRQLSARNRIRDSGARAQTPWTPPETPSSLTNRPNSRGSVRSQGHPSRPRSAAEPAPVPPDVTAVEALWGNRWWPATIIRRDGERAYVHYEGWSSARDEWVTPDRLRPRPAK